LLRGGAHLGVSLGVYLPVRAIGWEEAIMRFRAEYDRRMIGYTYSAFCVSPSCRGEFINDVPSLKTAYCLCHDLWIHLPGAISARYNSSRVKGMSMGLPQFLERIWDRKPTSELLLSQQRRQTVQGMRERLDRGG
jgi:hypothetical protein